MGYIYLLYTNKLTTLSVIVLLGFWRCLMATGSVFENNRTQAVRLPAGTRFPACVKKVSVQVRGCDRVLSPLNQTWDGFFLAEDDEDVYIERGEQGIEPDREPLE